MTNEEICKARYELKLEAAENESRRLTMVDIECEKHRNAVQTEADRHKEAMRRISVEAHEKAVDIQRRKHELSLEEARMKDAALATKTESDE